MRLRLPIIALLFFCCLKSTLVFSQTNAQDTQALVDLYNATGGANWTNKTNWLSGDASTWHGVTVSGGRVTMLNLPSNNLSGVVPESLGNLTNLFSLSFSKNQLTSIPVSIGSLSKLTNLILEYNQLTVLPASVGNLSKLLKFTVHNNQLTVLPSTIGNLTSVHTFYAMNNFLTSVPNEIGNMTSLKNLFIGNNSITAIPESIGNLSNLQLLQLSDNRLTALPKSLIQLTTLQDLDVSTNRLTFEDIEPLLPPFATFPTFTYSPQAPVATIFNPTTLTFSVAVDGNFNQYQWQKNTINIPGANATNFIIAAGDVNKYRCIIISTVVPNLTITSNEVVAPVVTSVIPIITFLSPASGPIGTTITINGSGFNTTAANNVVYFGAVKATITAATATQLTVTVPAGATSVNPVTVTNLSNNLSGSSITASTSPVQFTVTFSGGIVNSNSYVKTDYAVGSGPRGIVAADFNGDGKTDLATTNFTSNDISILLRKADNTGFETETRLTGGSHPEDVTVGDFDGNGRFDLAFLNKTTNAISIQMRNTANNGFDSPIVLSTGSFAQSLVAGDFNSDGKTDLGVTVTPGVGTGKLWIFLRNAGNTGFNIPSSTLKITINATSQGMATGDFNHDGLIDIAMAEASSNISVLYQNTSSMLFDAPVMYSTGGTNAKTIAVGDFNADGKIDLVVSALSGAMSVSVLLRKADNSGFEAALAIGLTADAYGLVVGDFNGDGRADVAETSFVNSLVGIYLWNTCNAFLATPVNFSVGTKPWDMVTGDFDGDGRADLASVNYGSDQVSVLTYQAQTPIVKAITLASLPNTPVCAVDLLTLSFTKTGNFSNCETFTAQLSAVNSNSFANPTLLATHSQSPIKTALPTGITPGTYQIRIVSNSGIISDLKSITIQDCRTITLQALANSSICKGDGFSLSFTKSGTFANGETYTAQLSNIGSSTFPTTPIGLGSANQSPFEVVIPTAAQPGTYNIRLVSSSGVISNLVSLTVNSCANLIQLSGFSDNTLCLGSSQSLSFTDNGDFVDEETYTAELSDIGLATFPTSPVVLGNSSSSPMEVVFPTEVEPGSYSIRLVSSSGKISNLISVIINGLPNSPSVFPVSAV
ncbi:MAG: FG-GAP-like repeat-containing protein, partial [Bacteroidota bacterium]